MRVAVVHDFLSQRGGAERVVLHLARRLPDPTIFTSLYAPEDTYPEFREHRVIASRRASGSEAKRFRSRALSYPVQFRDLDLSRFDLVIVSSSSFAHHVRHPHSAVYWHTPPRFLYDPGAYFSSRVAARALSLGLRPLRRPDREAAQ